MKVFTKKRILLIPAFVFLIAAILAIAIPAVASAPENYYGVQVSMGGNVSINYLYTDLGEADSVVVIVRNSAGEELSRKAVPVDDITQDENDRYVVSTKLAAAEMTNYVTVYTQKNGVKLGETHTYSVKSYAAEVLASEEYAEYHASIKAMLNYGAMAQAHFGVNTNDLANSDLYRGAANPIAAVTDIDCEAADWTNGTTLEFKGYEAVLESTTSFRIYFEYSGSGKLSATVEREGITAQPSAIFLDSANGRYYVKINNIGATLYDKQYTVKVTDGSDNLSVTASILNYADTVLASSETSETQKNAVRAMYNHYVWTADVAPEFTECDHAYTHEESVNTDSATAYVCSACGVEIKKVSDSIEIFKSPMQIADDYTNANPLQVGELLTDDDGTVFARLHGGSNIKDNYNTLYVYGNSAETGKYLVIKYRLPSDNPTAQHTVHWYAKSNASGSTWSICEINAPQDDKWHTVVVDLDQLTSDTTGFMPSTDGKYYANTIWFRPLSYSKQGTTEDTMDIAYIAMCNDLSDVSELVDEETYERHASKTLSTLVTTATNECLQHNAIETLTATTCSYECGFCEKDLGSTNIEGLNYYRSANQLWTSDYSSGHFAFGNSVSGKRVGQYMTEGDVAFSRFIINANKGAGHIYVHGHTQTNPYAFNGSSGRYLVMKIRSSGNIKYTLDMATVAGGQKATGSRSASGLGIDNQWQTIVFDLTWFANYTAYSNSTDGLVFRITCSGGTIGQDYIDISYFAIVDDLEEAQQIIGEDTYQYYKKGVGWNTLGKTCNTSTMSCANGCATKAYNTVDYTGGSVYAYFCSECGHEYSDRMVVPTDVNWYANPSYIDTRYYANGGELLVDEDGTVFARIKGGMAASYNSLDIATGNKESVAGQYCVIKYRLDPDNPTKYSEQHFYVMSYSVTDKANGSYTSPISYAVHQDGEWHIAVIDLSKHPSAANYKADATDGQYYLAKLWLRPLTINGKTVGTTDDYIDYAYVAMCDTLEDVAILTGGENYEMHLSATNSALFNPTTGRCVIHNYVESGSEKAYVYSCSVCGYVLDADVDRFFPVSSTQKVEAYQVSASSHTDFDENCTFLRYTGKDKAGQVNINRYPIDYSNKDDGTQKVTLTYGIGTSYNIGSGDKYLVVKIRTNDTNWQLGMYLGTKDANTITKGEDGRYTGSANRLLINYPMGMIEKDEWQILVIDMAKVLGQHWVANANGEYVIETLQFHSGNIPSSTHFDLEYYAFCDSWEDIGYLTGADNAIVIESSGKGRIVNAQDGSCAIGGCAIKETNDGATYKLACTACGKVYVQKNVANANKFVSAYDTSRYTTLFMPQSVLPTYKTEYNAVTGEYEAYSSHTHSFNNDANGHPINSEGHMYFFGSHVANGLLTVPIERAGQYLVLKFRTFEVSKMILEARTGDNAYNGSISRTTGFNNGWETMIVDLSEIASYEVGEENTTFAIRMKVFRAATADPVHTVHVAYAAIVDTLDEAAEVIGNDEINLYTSWSKAPATYTKTDVACTGSVLGHTMANATCMSDKVCDVCGITYAGPAGHSYQNTPTTATLVSLATDDTPATYYKSCVCGEISNETFTYGKTLNEMVDYSKTERFEEMAASITNGEKFLYFTDPHYVTSAADGTIALHYENAIGVMGKYFDKVGASFAISGGDWFNNSNTRENALANMADINSRMEAAFGKDFYLVVGNHDYNYQTKNESGSTVSSSHKLTREELDGAWFSDERYGGKSYYSFMGENTRFYVFDSGIDWGHGSMTDLDQAQVEWFLGELMKNDDAHIALAPHMLYTSESNLNPGTAKFLEIAEIYNNRGTFAYNGKLYDFADKTGRVEFLIAGHSHKDEVSVHNGIACILTINNTVSTPSFDLVAVDYDARVIHIVRVNSGTVANAQPLDRVVSLDIAE